MKVSQPADAGGQDDAQGGADTGNGGNDDGGQAAQAAQVPGSLPELEDNTQAQGAAAASPRPAPSCGRPPSAECW